MSCVNKDQFWSAFAPLLAAQEQHNQTSSGPLAVAVSGGADSMALLSLLEQTRAQHRRELLVLTFDHGLRAESAGEAARIGSYCGVHNLRHKILLWRGDKPASGVQAKAREARYRALLGAAQSAKAIALLTGHSGSDQAETFFARLARGSGVDGLSSMAPTRLMAAGAGAPLAVLRPLLNVSRAALRQYCCNNNIPFHDDPSNEDLQFERVRHRALLAGLEQQGFLSQQAVRRTISRLQAQSAALHEALAMLMTKSDGKINDDGSISLDRHVLNRSASQEGATSLVAALLHTIAVAVGGQQYGGERGDGRLFLNGMIASKNVTGEGAIMRVDKDRLWLMREPASLLGRADGTKAMAPFLAVPEQAMVWDRRFIVLPRRVGVIAPLGKIINGPLLLRDRLASLPALWPPERDNKGPQDGVFPIAVPNFVKNLSEMVNQPWIAGATDLNIRSLVPERLLQRVVRF